MKKFWRSFFKTFLFFCIIPCTILLGIFAGILVVFLQDTEPVDVDQLTMQFTSFIYYTDAQTGEDIVLQALYDEENRVWADLDVIPQYMEDAFVAIEDERFYKHNGFDPKRIVKAGVNYIARLFGGGSSVYGASTITQQLVKNVTGEDDVALERKAKEIYRAYLLEQDLEKEDILELYLNTIYLSQMCNGVASAANVYFDKNISDLSLAECACIAGITQFPSRYDPYLNPEANKEKQELVLAKMYELGFISQNEYEEAVTEQLEFKRGSISYSSKYSYFVDTVIEEVLYDLEHELGYSAAMAQTLLYTGGLKIKTTIDPSVQAAMDKVYQDDSYFPDAYGEGCIESAMVVLDPKTGAIVGIVGGRGEKDGSRTLNRATQTLRQPGSTIKPVGVYAPALDQNVITPATPMDDSPVTYTNASGSTWSPRNANGDFLGPISVETAIALSRNIPAVRVLDDLTPRKSFDFLTNKLHITSLIDKEERNGMVYSDVSLSPLSLGGLTDGVSVLEMTASYLPFDNKGIYREPHSYTTIHDYKDRLMIEKAPLSNVAISEYTAHYMRKYLSAVVSYGTGGSAAFRYDIATAGKTGTTTNDHDRWFIGFTPYYVAACWVGYDIPKPMNGVWGNPAITPWKTVMSAIHADKPAADFERPSDLLTVGICKNCGKLATDACHAIEGATIYSEFRAGQQPYTQCVAEECHAPEEVLPEFGNSLSGIVLDPTSDSEDTPTEISATSDAN